MAEIHLKLVLLPMLYHITAVNTRFTMVGFGLGQSLKAPACCPLLSSCYDLQISKRNGFLVKASDHSKDDQADKAQRRESFVKECRQRRMMALGEAAALANLSIAQFIGSTRKEQKLVLGGLNSTYRRRLLRNVNSKFRPSIKPRIRRKVFLRDNCTCTYCGQSFIMRDLTVDHKKPISKGGLNILENMVSACLPCNQAKRDLYVHDDHDDLLDRKEQ